jgi:hypothetical protein
LFEAQAHGPQGFRDINFVRDTATFQITISQKEIIINKVKRSEAHEEKG